MSSIIRITPEYKAKLLEDFEKHIERMRVANGRSNYPIVFDSVNAKAKLMFTEPAWMKMQALVREFDKEVAWHGVAERGEDNVYIVSDILVYPQEVGAATVEMDTEEYAKWIQAGIMAGDERFDHFYFQGHSHVNMATSPSSVDLQHQEEILNSLRPDGFYIFVIWNKRNDHTVKIYDLAKNTLFENADVSVEVIEDANGIEKFIREAKKIVKTKTYTPPSTYTGQTYGGSYGGYGGSEYSRFQGGYNPPVYTGKPSDGTAKPVEKPVEKPVSKTTGKTAGKQQKATNANAGKGKGKGATKKNKVVAASTPKQPVQTMVAGYDDDEDNPTSPFYVRDGYARDYWRD